MNKNQENGGVEIVVEDKDKENGTVSGKAIDLDDVLTNEVGEFGLFQFRNVLLLAVLILTFGTLQEYIFSTAATPHRCRIPECGEYEKMHDIKPEWIKNAVPEISTGLASCEKYASTGLQVNGTLDYCPANFFDQSITIPCNDFVYAKDNTVIYEFNLGCKEWLRVLAGTLFNVGMLFAMVITGIVSDHFGRKVALVFNILNLGIFGLMRAFSVNYTMYLILQIVQSTLGTGVYSTAYIMAAELVGPKYRIIVGVTCTAMFATGEAVLGAVAWAISPWRYMIIALTIPWFLYISYYWIISESVRWLLSKKKYSEAKQILLTVAKVNKKEISEKSLEALVSAPPQLHAAANTNNPGLVRTVIRSPVLLRRVCTTPVWWIGMTFVYYGMSINSTSLSDTMHLNYILMAIIGVPAFYVSAFVLARIGRRATISGSFILSSICCISFVFISNDLPILRLVIYLIGKFFISLVGSSLYLYTCELYPTEYRHTLLGFSSMLGRVGSILAPLTPALMTYYHGLPSLLFGGMAAIAGLLALTQPETLGCKLPDTLEEAEAIGTPSSKITSS
ncbi:organic cation transporter protein-like [Bicyclus anynana]|uniref:Organic cation transporter protein-like n=1 Tax=Bicyclus anynana TaxID=110368 RepID=A0A6J1MYR2_BICAN|nr:organic cation transporter protein-like [Bicyclus anynana]